MTIIPYIDRAAPFPLDPAIALLGNVRQGAAFDFLSMRGYVRDRGTPANFFLGDPNDLLTYTSPSPKYVRGSNGLLSSGTTLRCDHDVAGNPLGVLLESLRLNEMLYSDIGPAAADWPTTGTNTITAGQADPSGGTNAILFNDTDAGAISYIRRTQAIANDSVVRCHSFWAKAGTSGRAYFRIAYTGGTPVLNTLSFNFSTLQWSTAGGGYEAMSNGWYRLWRPLTNNGSGNTVADIRMGATENVASQTGSVYLYGYQQEIVPNTSSPPSSYIRTEGSQVTRAADNLNLAASLLPGTKAAGTLIAKVRPGTIGVEKTPFMMDTGAADNQVRAIVEASANFRPRFRLGAFDLWYPAGAGTIGNGSKIALAWDAPSAARALDGAVASQAISGDFTVLTTLRLGALFNLGANLDGHLEWLVYIPERLSNAELQARTAP